MRRNRQPKKDAAVTEGITQTDRLLALVLVQNMKEATQKDKIFTLSCAGLPISIIAELLGVKNVRVASQQLYEMRSLKSSKKGKRKNKK